MFYDRLNRLIDQIEQQLDSEIDYLNLAKSIGINLTTLQKLFPLIAGISLADYVRKRRLTLAGKDLVQSDLRIIDIAFKYGYSSTAAFSRAFYNFHQVKPSQVKNHPKQLKCLPRLTFSAPQEIQDINYEIIETPELYLRGLKIISDYDHIKLDAPAFFQKIFTAYPELPHPYYGILVYGDGRNEDRNYQYYILWPKELVKEYSDFIDYRIPSSRWLKFALASQDSNAIQSAATRFYQNFLPTCTYQLRPEPDLEHYHDNATDFLVPIY